MNGGSWEKIAAYLDNGNETLDIYGQSADGSIKYFEGGKINSKYESLWDKYEVSEEEKTNKIKINDGTTLTQAELWDWSKKEEKYHEARKRITEETYNNMEKHKGIAINEVGKEFSFYAPYGNDQNKKTYGWFKTLQQAIAGTQEYARTWDNDYMMMGGIEQAFIVRSGSCGSNSGAGVIDFNATTGVEVNHNGFRSVIVL